MNILKVHHAICGGSWLWFKYITIYLKYSQTRVTRPSWEVAHPLQGGAVPPYHLAEALDYMDW